MVDSSLSTNNSNESNNEKLENTKTIEKLQNTKTVEQVKIENTKIYNEEEEDRWGFLGRRNEKLEFAYHISRIDDTSLELLAMEDKREVSSDKFTTLKCIGKLNEQSMELMLDTGATASLIRTSLLRKLPNYQQLILKSGQGMSVRVANGARLYSRGTIDLKVDIANVKITHEFMIFDEVPFNAILGMDYIFKGKWIVNIPEGKLKSEAANAQADLIMLD